MSMGSTMGKMTARAAAGACALLVAGGLAGCSLNTPFTTPTRAEVEREKPAPTLTASDLVTEGVLTVAMDGANAPQAMTDADGLPSGYYADVARAIAERCGLDLAVVSATSTSKTLAEDEADLYFGAEPSDADEDVIVTDPVLENASSLFMKYDGDAADAPAPALAEVSGSVIAVQRDSASQDALARAGIGAELKPCANVNECFEALAAGEADYVACDATAGAYLCRAYPNTVFAAVVGSSASFGIAVEDGSGTLASEIRAALNAIMEDGTLEAIHRFWYGDLPASLDGELLDGVTLTSADDEDEKDASGEDGTAEQTADSELAISGDLNSLD